MTALAATYLGPAINWAEMSGFSSAAQPAPTRARPLTHQDLSTWYSPVFGSVEGSSIGIPSASNVTSDETAADRAVSQLLNLGYLEDDWDGEGAAAPNPASIRDAHRFLRSLDADGIMPMSTLHANGNALLVFDRQDAYAEIEFLGAGEISYFARLGSARLYSEDGETFDGRTIPERLRAFRIS